jgi:N-carbamoylputrescine amidase
MSNIVKIAAVQMHCEKDVKRNIENAENKVREAAFRGANIILLPELFSSLYFCQEENNQHFSLSQELENSELIQHFQKIAKELSVVLPLSFFEKSNLTYYNSVVLIDADASILGLYRKSHIPAGPGYEEKYYFSPGDTGFKVWNTRYGKIGVAICWDQWFPEAARIMALSGAQILFYPTAIGSEPSDPNEDSKERWQKCMTGHAISNVVGLVAANRVGVERFQNSEIRFYGSSFITNHKGEILAQSNETTPDLLIAQLDLDAIDQTRLEWPFFRDRRPELYGSILTKDGHTLCPTSQSP